MHAYGEMLSSYLVNGSQLLIYGWQSEKFILLYTLLSLTTLFPAVEVPRYYAVRQ